MKFGVPIPANSDDALLEASGGNKQAYAIAARTLEQCIEDTRWSDAREAHTPCLCTAVDVDIDSSEGRTKARLTPLILQRGSKHHPGQTAKPAVPTDSQNCEGKLQEAKSEISGPWDATEDETSRQKLSAQQRQTRLIEQYMYDDEDEFGNEGQVFGNGNQNRRVDWSSESSSSEEGDE